MNMEAVLQSSLNTGALKRAEHQLVAQPVTLYTVYIITGPTLRLVNNFLPDGGL
jgi:hypothetical protein